LRAELLTENYGAGDFEFARHGIGTGFESFMVLGRALYLICNNTHESMETIAKNPRWLAAQVPFAELGEKFRPIRSPSRATIRSFSGNHDALKCLSVYFTAALTLQFFIPAIPSTGKIRRPHQRPARKLRQPPQHRHEERCTSVAPSRMNMAA